MSTDPVITGLIESQIAAASEIEQCRKRIEELEPWVEALEPLKRQHRKTRRARRPQTPREVPEHLAHLGIAERIRTVMADTPRREVAASALGAQIGAATGTVRTTLKRMEVRGEVAQRDGRWVLTATGATDNDS